MADQFIVEERIGCVAIMDTTKVTDSPGLHCDTLGVVRYWQGSWENGHWHVPERFLKEAHKVCCSLNEAI